MKIEQYELDDDYIDPNLFADELEDGFIKIAQLGEGSAFGELALIE